MSLVSPPAIFRGLMGDALAGALRIPCSLGYSGTPKLGHAWPNIRTRPYKRRQKEGMHNAAATWFYRK